MTLLGACSEGDCMDMLCSESVDLPPEGVGAMTLSVDSYPKESLEVMDLMRRQGFLCDVEIRVGSESFPAHRLVLLAMSPYFRAMFAGGLREAAMPVVQIQGVGPSTMASVMKFAYTGSICIDQRNVCQLLPAATMFQVSEGEEFLGLTASQLVALVRRDELNVRCESEVFNAVLRWVKHDEHRRRAKMADVLYAVRCHFLTPRFLMHQLQTCDLVRSMPQCCDYLHRIIQDLTGRRQYTVSQRRPQVAQVVYCVGGYQQHSLGALECLCPPQQWFRLAELGCPRSGLGAAFLGGKLYAVGGRNNSQDKSYDCASVDCYDPVANAWSACADLQVPRNRVGVAVLDGLLYAVGGSCGTTQHYSVERYDPAEDKWSYVASMARARIGVGVAVQRRLLFALGGYNGQARLSSVECYDPDRDQWVDVAPMNTCRSGAGVVAVERWIYVVGGYDGSSQLTSAERYDVERDQWDVVASMKEPRSALALAHLGGKIYALGGYDGTDFLSSVEIFDLESEQWSEGTPMQAGRSGHAAAVWRAPHLMHSVL
ncbi:kelch-like ECH-associated protein 1 isoform X2 [Rhipicephalus sanguineus]|uniref:kelch-like ECH-associated protein 1 isoform X2 n=1 Tax=Rhipicephalus sanguineus TaxID=34632 RepID=UPI0020C46BF9|nr:kelch-like ECH-associated protein 1 isoform X2 [Rhipicephalus sanguineus]